MSEFKIYTKTGDDGTSSLYNGERRNKDDVIFDALGDVDEVNSNLGLCREHCLRSESTDLVELNQQIATIQSRMLDVGSAVATPLSTSAKWKANRVEFSSENVAQLESWIDRMDEQLPKLVNFILPSGGLAASHLHVTRTVCRRAERKVVPLVRDKIVGDAVAKYLNRLSDYLFIAARYAAKMEKYEEVAYKKA